MASQTVQGSYWFYAPNKIAPICFTVAFAISAAWHLIQCIMIRSWKITGLLPFTAVIFTAGFLTREIGAYHYDDSNLYIASTILIYMAPPILELANYHIFGRVLYYVPYSAPIHPGRTLTTFGFLSSIVEVLNGIGVAWTANHKLSSGMINVAAALLKASLIVQIVVILLFYSMIITFHVRCHGMGIMPRHIQIPILTLYATSFLVLIRCVYRTIEHFSNDGLGSNSQTNWRNLTPLVRYEWYFYAFEASLMLVVMVAWNVLHPRRFLPENHRIYLARDGVSEVQGPGWTDNRSFFVTLFDPFGCMSNTPANETPFWETDGIQPKWATQKLPTRRSFESSNGSPYGSPYESTNQTRNFNSANWSQW
ncbi:hypothetical protein ANO11243_003450 [Dothideomycetidae sp. 11243]|nr:hypothetical protein ANO11243_003450 [fungal sp. No.11243]